MLRFRRYRVFVAFAVITLFALYKFGSSGASWQDASLGAEPSEGQKEDTADVAVSKSWNARPQIAQETKKPDLEIPAASASQSLQTPPPVAPVSRPAKKPPHAPTKPAAQSQPAAAGDGSKPPASLGDELVEGGVGRVEAEPLPTSIEPIHWQKQSEHFPVPTNSIVKLPSGKPKPIPKIQHTFEQESTSAKADREGKLNIIKGVFKRSWDGYREHAWLQDELSPVSGKYRNPFAAWGATLVDALDTLWIMGMKKEFEEAVKAIDEIDFTTTTRADIPLFETTIRYLGGFLAAYDLSDRKYESLLTKATQLAEVLISAFDTPNRMPQTYYYWRPAFASQPHRASNHVVLAEIGSLSVEFTRLAQITGEHKYYDAIARITDNLEEFQNKTRLPGMWPAHLDASGCKRIEYTSEADTPLQAPLEGEPLEPAPSNPDKPTATTEELSPEGHKYTPLDLPPPIVFVAESGTPMPSSPPTAKGEVRDAELPQKDSEALKKRQLDDTEAPLGQTHTNPAAVSSAASASPTPTRPECEEQGFVPSSPQGFESYTLGGESDSTYEYLPKEWLLLGGQVEKYRAMYEQSMDVVKENLIFRPMLPKMNDILFSGKLNAPPHKPKLSYGELEGENAHLTCFAGGMFGMGAKIFDRPDDLEIAKKLTEGCIWSYDMTSTGIMPESFLVVPCESRHNCEWNETKYWQVIDPFAESRVVSYKQQMETYEQQMSSASAWYEAELASMTATPSTMAALAFEAAATAEPTAPESQAESEPGKQKRQLDAETQTDPPTVPPPRVPEHNLMVEGEMEEAEGPPTPVQPESSVEPSQTMPAFPVIYSPRPPLNHEDYVKNRIQEERLPPGVTSIRSRNYILRPEAIESVWYMYRITGDPHWREAGWRMFEAVNTHTSTVYGNSAIDDVTKTSPELNDEMESFWLAETLKYFYLLFAEENVISLDEWVLNTEAHPFRRPK